MKDTKNTIGSEKLLSENTALIKENESLANANKSLNEKLTITLKRTEALNEQVDFLKEENAQLKQDLLNLAQRLRLANDKTFGKSSEVSKEAIKEVKEHLSGASPEVFNDVDAEATKERKKRVVFDLDTLEKAEPIHITLKSDIAIELCAKYGCPISETGIRVIKTVKYIPGKYVCQEIFIHQYSPKDVFDVNGNNINIEPSFPELVPNSMLTPSLLTHLATMKFLYALPLYRLEKIAKKGKFPVSRQWISQCMENVYVNYLKDFIALFKNELLAQDIIHADETSIKIVSNKKKGYVWFYRTDRTNDKQIVYLKTEEGRSSEYPFGILGNYNGYLITDGYAGYNVVDKCNHVYCFAHIRRKFVDAIKVAGEIPNSLSEEGFKYCQAIYKVEKKIRHLSPEERAQKRQEETKPIYEEFMTWLTKYKNQVNEKTALGRAIDYAYKLVPSLTHTFNDGRLEIDNNICERTVKSFVIGRKNFLFNISTAGAQITDAYYSLVLTASENNLDINDYLEYLFMSFPQMKHSEMERYLPWSPDMKAKFYLSKNKDQ